HGQPRWRHNGALAESHGHGHGHGHDDDQHHDPIDPAVDDGEIDGRAIRAAKDAEGRHDAGYYRTRDSVQPDRPQPPKPKVTADRGTRSFGAGLGRKRAL
ncbi:MAG: hypothetical protein ACXWYP_10130, partial [Pseudonocardia sp.]